MKKLAMVALVTATSAFAWTGGKSMVELNGCFDGTCDTLDLEMSSDTADFNDSADADEETTRYAINYNWLFTDNFGAGLVYVNNEQTVDGYNTNQATYNTMGLNLFWNMAGGWDSSYVGLRYWLTNTDETESATGVGSDDAQEQTDIVLEYGKRMKMGQIFGMDLLYSPSVSYTMTTESSDTSGSDDREATALSLNPVNFSVAF